MAQTATKSNLASVVGRCLSIYSETDKEFHDGALVAYNPETNKYTVQFKADGSEKSMVLNATRFTWVAQRAEPAQNLSYKKRKDLGIKMHVVGRRLQVYHKSRQKWYKGGILEYVEQADKHKVQFEKGGAVKLLNLEKHKWQFTDLVSSSAYTRGLSTSR